MKKILILLSVISLSISSVFAGWTSLKKTKESLENFKSWKEYIIYIDTFLESVSEERLQEIYDRAGNAHRNTELQAQLTWEISAILEYVFVKAYYELNPELYAQDIQEVSKVVKSWDIISVHYTGKLEDGTVFDSSYDRGEALGFTAGAWQMIIGFDAWVMWMSVWETKTLTIAPDEAYGERVEALEEVPKSDLQSFTDGGFLLEIGEILPTQYGEFEIIWTTDDTVFIDMNHPLAGKNLIFEVEIMEIK